MLKNVRKKRWKKKVDIVWAYTMRHFRNSESASAKDWNFRAMSWLLKTIESWTCDPFFIIKLAFTCCLLVLFSEYNPMKRMGSVYLVKFRIEMDLQSESFFWSRQEDIQHWNLYILDSDNRSFLTYYMQNGSWNSSPTFREGCRLSQKNYKIWEKKLFTKLCDLRRISQWGGGRGMAVPCWTLLALSIPFFVTHLDYVGSPVMKKSKNQTVLQTDLKVCNFQRWLSICGNLT